eukprot:scaffold10079_cov113-Isochrysis_galbana.AAC.4
MRSCSLLQPACQPAHRDSLMAASHQRMSLKSLLHTFLNTTNKKDLRLTAEANKPAAMLRAERSPSGNLSQPRSHFADILQSVQTLGMSATKEFDAAQRFTPVGKGPRKGMNAQERGTFSPEPQPPPTPKGKSQRSSLTRRFHLPSRSSG